uniref:Uncharacterized protein n=1 Tax=Homo sapiens TaxID=9606 RepID=Q96S24_HUMAN|nr:unknown [Homo sapiens]
MKGMGSDRTALSLQGAWGIFLSTFYKDHPAHP